ncbi:MAG: hypothetical protein PHW86_02115, partial [Candidatus Bipolaricaulis sp.]|nr:hypothetical protein [Candidatus Bipolaricaulis sp.]
NVYGEVLPVTRPSGERYVVRRLLGNYLVVRGGAPILAVEAHGARLIPLADVGVSERRAAFRLLARLVRHAGQRAAVRVETWEGHPVTETPVASDLASAGFIREDRTMILYREFGMAR